MSRLIRKLLIGIPLLFLVPALLYPVVKHGVGQLSVAPVHEDGVRTFFETILFFDHALGELPIDMLLGVFIAAGVTSRLKCDTGQNALRRSLLGVLTLAVILLIIIGACWTVGVGASLSSLLQEQTRRDAPGAWGSHWHYHLLSRVALGCWALALVRFIGGTASQPAGLTQRERNVSYLFGGITILSLPTLSFLIDGRFLGHQARELATHAVTTVPLALAAALWAGGVIISDQPISQRLRNCMASLIAVLLIGAYLIIATLAFGGLDSTHTNDVSLLIGGHFLEHSLGYLLTASCAAYFTLRWRST